MTTQLEAARAGRITEAMRAAAAAEGVPAEVVRERVAAGTAVLPVNAGRAGMARPAVIGEGFRVKVNANLGTSLDVADPEEELAKLEAALAAGADAVMDLSLGGDLGALRREVVRRSPVPVGTVPVYEAEVRAAARGGVLGLTADELLEVVEEHARDGVDFVTVHAGLTRWAVERLREAGRTAGIVSRGGALLAAWMAHHGRENPLYERFDDLLEIARRHDLTLSLGDGLRPGATGDATDRPQLAELVVLGELVERARRAGVQAMVEGPGHVPLPEIAANVTIAKRLTCGAPFYILGMLPLDVAAGWDHVAGAIGGAVAAWHGADMLCAVTPAEHLALPTPEQVADGVKAFRVAAAAADLARGLPAAVEANREVSRARFALDWEGQLRRALFPEDARRIHEARPSRASSCSMCGEVCPMRLTRLVTGERPAARA